MKKYFALPIWLLLLHSASAVEFLVRTSWQVSDLGPEGTEGTLVFEVLARNDGNLSVKMARPKVMRQERHDGFLYAAFSLLPDYDREQQILLKPSDSELNAVELREGETTRLEMVLFRLNLEEHVDDSVIYNYTVMKELANFGFWTGRKEIRLKLQDALPQIIWSEVEKKRAMRCDGEPK